VVDHCPGVRCRIWSLRRGERAGLGRLDPPVHVTPYVLRHTYAYMLRQAGVSTEVRAEMSGHSIETAMKYGWPKAREKERVAEALDEMVTVKYSRFLLLKL